MASRDPQAQQSRIMSRLQRLLNEDNYYEALQLYLTLYSRYVSNMKLEEAGDLLYEGVQVFLSRGLLESAEELVMKWGDHLKTHSIPVTEREVSRILTIPKQFPIGQKEAGPIIKLMRTCIKWSQANGDRRVGHAALHFELAELLWSLQRYHEAKKHFIHGEQPKNFALHVLDLSLKGGYPGETGLFVTQTILYMVVAGYVQEASVVFTEFVTNHPNLGGVFPYRGYPLLNYTHMILEVLLDESMRTISPIEKCQYLTQQYMTALQTDPSIMELINKLKFVQMHSFPGLLPAFPEQNIRVEESEILD